ncbi:MAG: hypothetical protein QUS13_13405 [Smithella sp.]|nr:hypothetical protein [Smithella sp.]HQI73429.1 hypothetical protein [Smithella sp.]
MIQSIKANSIRTLLLLLSFSLLLFLTSCGGSMEEDDTETTSGSGLQIALSASTATLSAGQSTVVTAKVTDSAGAPVQNKTINFTCSGGSCPSGGTITAVNGGVTDAGGNAVAIYKAGSATTALSLEDTISATSGKASAALVITRTASTATTYLFTMSAGSTSLSAGQSTVISVAVTDGNGAPVHGQTVTFTKEVAPSNPTLTTLGTGVTDASGKVQAVYTAGNANPTANVQDTISATISGGAAYAVVIITRVGSATSGTATTGYSMTVTADPITAAAGNHSIITAKVVDSASKPVSGMSVTFAFLPNSSIGSTLSATSGYTDASGSFTTIYTAGSGGTGAVQDVIQTTVTGVGCNTNCPTCGYSTTAAVIVTRTTTSGTASGIRVDLTAAPTSVDAGGQSVLTATVLDGTNNPVPGATVNFGFINNTTGASLRDSDQTTPGLTSVTGTTDGNGQAVAIYTTGATNAGVSLQDTVNVNASMGTNSSSDAVIITRTGTSGGGSTVTASSLDLSASPTSIRTDGSSFSTITVNALNSSNALLSGVVVTLSTDTGILSSPTVTTNSTTPATVRLYSGSNKENRTVTVTATAGTATAQIPVFIVGSTVTLAASASSISNAAPGNVSNLTVTVRDAGSTVVPNATVTLTQSPAGRIGFGAGLAATYTATTNASGQITVAATGLTNGAVTITASALGATATTTLTVTDASTVFAIDQQRRCPGAYPGTCAVVAGNPDPTAMYLTDTLEVRVNAPDPIANVVFATTAGTFYEAANPGNTGSVITVPVDGSNKATAYLRTSTAGIANINVYDQTTPSTSDTLTVAMTSATPASIELQASPTVVPTSVGTTTGSSTLIAMVRDSGGFPVGNAAVLFSIDNPTGGGETVSPVVAMSAATTSGGLNLGEARASFTSGSLPSAAGGIQVRASIVGTPTINDLATIVIGGVAGSIAFGQATVLGVDATNANYTLDMSVMVADSNGNPAPAGTIVTLSLWPIAWSTGSHCMYDGDGCTWDFTLPVPTCSIPGNYGTFWNEDSNENLILDSGEDGVRAYYADPSRTPLVPAGTPDGYITAVNSRAGTVPATVTTDANGVAGFKLTYPKTSAIWTVVRVRASTVVQGTETVGEVTFRLEPLAKDVNPDCLITGSPYHY